MKNINRNSDTIGGGLKFPLPVFILAAAAAAMALMPQWVFADIADRINFQGRLMDPATKNPVNGDTDFTFRICDSLAGDLPPISHPVFMAVWVAPSTTTRPTGESCSRSSRRARTSTPG